MIVLPIQTQGVILAAAGRGGGKPPLPPRFSREALTGYLAGAAGRLKALVRGRNRHLPHIVSVPARVVVPETPATRAMEAAPTNTVEVIERTAMLLRIGSGVLNRYFAELAPRYGGVAALVAIRSFPDFLVDIQVHTRWDLADMVVLAKDLDRYGEGLAHDAAQMCAAINVLKGWGVYDTVHEPANTHIDAMFLLIRELEGEEGLSLCRREIARAFLNVQEARVHMYNEFVAKGYEIPPVVRDWIATQPAMRDVRLALTGIAAEGKKSLRILLDALNQCRDIGVEGLTIMAYVEGEGRIRNWIEGLANEGGELKAFIYDPRLGLGAESEPERRHIAWKDDLMRRSPIYRRGIESRHLRAAWLYPDERRLPEEDPTQTEGL